MADEKPVGKVEESKPAITVPPKAAESAPKAEPAPKAPAQEDFTVVRYAVGRFAIYGKGFGASGTVRIAGHQAITTEWSSVSIAGQIPDEVAAVPASASVVEVIIDGQTAQRGVLRF